MKLYSYVLKNDAGFAPNPYWGYCTLACCKPKIRNAAVVGDWIVGTGSVNNVGSDKLIYAMMVAEKITFQQYYKDKRFESKIPRLGKTEERGDNIYHLNENGEWIQRRFYHIEKDKIKDLSVNNVLISENYFYFGKKAPLIPQQFNQVIKCGPSHKCKFNSDFIADFIRWIENNFKKGIQGEPFDFEQRLKINVTAL